jgi:hypothetical protein
MPHEEALPFWLVNVPQDQWPSECPEFLRGISDKDKGIIGTPDDQYTLLTWDEVREIVSMNVSISRSLYPREIGFRGYKNNHNHSHISITCALTLMM